MKSKPWASQSLLSCETVHESLIEEKIGDIRDVYLIRGSVTGHIKIGVATNVLERLPGNPDWLF